MILLRAGVKEVNDVVEKVSATLVEEVLGNWMHRQARRRPARQSSPVETLDQDTTPLQRKVAAITMALSHQGFTDAEIASIVRRFIEAAGG